MKAHAFTLVLGIYLAACAQPIPPGQRGTEDSDLTEATSPEAGIPPDDDDGADEDDDDRADEDFDAGASDSRGVTRPRSGGTGGAGARSGGSGGAGGAARATGGTGGTGPRTAGSGGAAGGSTGGASGAPAVAGMSGTAGSGPIAPDGTDSLLGTWSGEGMDINGPRFTLCVTIEQLSESQRAGTVDYRYTGPTTRCTGEITFTGMMRDVYVFTERVSGPGCTPVGRTNARLNADGSMDWQWFRQDREVPQEVALLTKGGSCAPSGMGAGR